MRKRTKPTVFRDLYYMPYNDLTRVKLYRSTKDSLDLVQRLELIKTLPIHNGCVNSLCWNETGEFLLSGSDDHHLVVTHGYNYKVVSDYKTTHRANIFSAKFLPVSGDTRIVSCSGDGIILYTDLLRVEETRRNQFTCHSGTTYEVLTAPRDPHTFLSCGEDGTVRWFDLRIKSKCLKPQCTEDVMLECPRAATTLALSPLAPFCLAVGCSDSTVRLFDRRMLSTRASGGEKKCGTARPLCSFTVPEFNDRNLRITSLSFSPQGDELLASFSSDHLYLFDVKAEGVLALLTAPVPCQREAAGALVAGECWGGTGEAGGVAEGDKRRALPPVRRLRLRGDWSDTGPDARPERDAAAGGGEGSGGGGGGGARGARPTLHATLMQRMTDVLTRMLNDPATRAALSGDGEEQLRRAAGVDGAGGAEQHRQEGAGASDESLEESGSSPGGGAEERAASSLEEEEEEEERADDGKRESGGEREGVEEGEAVGGLRETNENEDGIKFMESKIGSLQDKLSTLREGFIERHGSEPAVCLTYSEKGSSSATISLGVADEMSRSLSAANGAASSSAEEPVAGPSHCTPTLVPVDPTHTSAPAVGGASPEGAPRERLLASRDAGDAGDPTDADCFLFTKGSGVSDRFVPYVHDHSEDSGREVAEEAKEEVEEEAMQRKASLIKQKFMGHRNARTMIKEAGFWGDDFVLSGSDCGHVFFWERASGRLCMLLQADRHVVNCLQPHPALPLLATAGIDHDVKLWAPAHEQPAFDADAADALMKRNEVMLEETKDTITVPASFMIRMLACLTQIRRGERSRTRHARRQDRDDSSDN